MGRGVEEIIYGCFCDDEWSGCVGRGTRQSRGTSQSVWVCKWSDSCDIWGSRSRERFARYIKSADDLDEDAKNIIKKCLGEDAYYKILYGSTIASDLVCLAGLVSELNAVLGSLEDLPSGRLGKAPEIGGESGRNTGTVWDNITPTQGNYPNTNVPKSFEIEVNGEKITQGNWEFIFAQPRQAGQLPVIKHAQFMGWH